VQPASSKQKKTNKQMPAHSANSKMPFLAASKLEIE
jgi:hypothetical protein